MKTDTRGAPGLQRIKITIYAGIGAFIGTGVISLLVGIAVKLITK
jgi:hypothetical protein